MIAMFNNDVVQEILLHLPVQTLLRLRAVSKLWRDVIDSPSFQKLHTHNSFSNKTVCLEFYLVRPKLLIKLRDNGKSLKLHHNFNDLFPDNEYVRFVGAVKGLICIYYSQAKFPIVICNPFLGQLKILPRISPFAQCGQEGIRDVGIGFDGDYYKVVELLFCYDHGHQQARVYSGRTDSWRALAGFDQRDVLRIIKPVKSSSKNGYFAHWLASATGGYEDCVVLTFDMRNEVFRVTKNLGCCRPGIEILAKCGEDGEEESFVVFYFYTNLVDIYVQRRNLNSNWKKRKRVVIFEDVIQRRLWKVSDYYVVLEKANNPWREKEVILYDHRARKFVGQFELPVYSMITEYTGSFISLY